MPHAVVRRAGVASVTDLGRPGLARYGIAANGAADQYSAAAANLLVGNPAPDPLIEVTGSAFELTGDVPLLVAVTGAPAEVTVAGRAQPMWQPLSVASGERVAVSVPRVGVRCYLAAYGAFAAPVVLGSSAPDRQLGVGSWLAAGVEVPLGGGYTPFDHPVARQPLLRYATGLRGADRFGADRVVAVTDGPDAAEFGDTAATLFAGEYTVTPAADHVGLRLAGPRPSTTGPPERLSRGVPVGAVEVPPGPELIVLRRGRPVTAGYPVVAVVTRVAQSTVGQLGPGDRVRFRHSSLADAVAEHRRERAELAELAGRVRTVFDRLGLPCRLATVEVPR